MFQEEKVINGVLCFRTTPCSEWKQYSLEAMTIALTAERGRANRMNALFEDANERLERVRHAMSSNALDQGPQPEQ